MAVGDDLHPGDRRILRVEPVTDMPQPPEPPWTCSACGTEQGDVRQWLLHLGEPSASRRELFVICPDCAHRLAPVRLHMDLTAFEPVVSERPQLRAVGDLARSVIEARGRKTEAVRLRAADTVTLADRLRMTPTELVTELYALGVLAP